MLEVKVPQNYTLMIEGPAKMRVKEGAGEVFGLKFSEGFETQVDLFKAAPFYATSELRLVIEEGKLWYHIGRTIPETWDKLAQKCIEEKPKKIMVIGSVDVGKSGLVTYLFNQLVQSGLKVGVVDADTGQSDIGPPTTIGLGVSDKPVVMLSEIPLYDAFFIGLTSPSGLLHRSITGVSLMVEKALENLHVNTVIIDTTGWVTSPEGRDLKIMKALNVAPDLIVAIGEEKDLAHITRFLSKFYDVVYVEPAISLRPRNREERREIRRSMYEKYFIDAETKDIPFDHITSSYSFIFSGLPLNEDERKQLEQILDTRIVYGERSLDSIVLLVETPVSSTAQSLLSTMYDVKYVRILTGVELIHTLVSFGDKEKMFKGLGIIEGIDVEKQTLRVFTNVDVDENMFLQFGYIKVNPSTFEEEGWIEKWSF